MPCPYECAVKGANLNVAATLRSRSAGSQDESRCSAIHKFNCSGKPTATAARFDEPEPAATTATAMQGFCGEIVPHSLKAVPRKLGWRYTFKHKASQRQHRGEMAALRFFGRVGWRLGDGFAFVEAGPVV